MKKTLFAIAAIAALCCSSCTKKLEDRVGVLEEKVAALETKVNANVTTIEKLLTASAKAITITSVVYDNAGFYDVTFSDGNTVRVTKESLVGVKEVGGVLYWTLNGDVLYDDNGAAIRVADAAPVFKFVDGGWIVSYDGGISWSEVTIATTEIAVTLTQTDEEYVFTIGDVNITLSKDQVFAIKVETYAYRVDPNTEIDFNYTVTGADETVKVLIEAVGVEASIDEAAQKVTVKTGALIEPGYVLVKAVRNSDGKWSAQYINIKKEHYGAFGGVIVSDENEYLNW